MSDSGLWVKVVRMPSPINACRGNQRVRIELGAPLTKWDKLAIDRTKGSGLTVKGGSRINWDPDEASGDLRSAIEFLNLEVRTIANGLKADAIKADAEGRKQLQALADELDFELV